jgi:hypothetical protein
MNKRQKLWKTIEILIPVKKMNFFQESAQPLSEIFN